MRICLICSLLIISLNGFSQALMKSIYRPFYGGYMGGASFMQNADGSYNLFTHDAQLNSIRLDSSGNVIWANRINTTGLVLSENPNMDRISDSAFIIVCSGFYTAYIFDIVLAKVNISGQPLWIKTIGSSVKDEYGFNVKYTQDGGFLVTGSKWIGSVGPANAYVVKTDSNGNRQWAKTFNRPRMDNAYDAVETSDAYYIAGESDSIGIDISGSFGLLIKTDKSGNTLWTKGYGAPLSIVYSIIKYDNSFLLAGAKASSVGFTTDATFRDAVLSKTDTMGNPIWTKQYHFSDPACAQKVIKTNDKGYLVTGITESYPTDNYNFFLLKTDSMGNEQWCNSYGSVTRGYKSAGAFQDTNGNFIALAECYGYNEALMLFNTDSLGNAAMCASTLTPIVSSHAMLDSALVFDEAFYNDSSVNVSFSVIADSMSTSDSCYALGPVGITELPVGIFNLYPNPSSGTVYFESQFDNFEITITNALGQQIIHEKQFPGKSPIDLSNYPKGFYICNVRADDGTTCTKGFILR